MADKTVLILDTCVWCNFLQNREWDFTIFRNLSQLVKEDEVSQDLELVIIDILM
ncbi:hypothetical protein [Bacillus pseudomycoides]|uniref:hypothetical protein n=1 Tax=Bacillus pseudomycoides TaxID=64104 RepID=UPI000504FB72|nr:hypothetical protein [Bacillus pseudomycoides]KFN13644.1 hypothetical protein DJ94_1451 [Bacillus pseudomycoides]MED0857242.1 hypothetical protein [Bacillus pseudomycoides]